MVCGSKEQEGRRPVRGRECHQDELSLCHLHRIYTYYTQSSYTLRGARTRLFFRSIAYSFVLYPILSLRPLVLPKGPQVEAKQPAPPRTPRSFLSAGQHPHGHPFGKHRPPSLRRMLDKNWRGWRVCGVCVGKRRLREWVRRRWQSRRVGLWRRRSKVQRGREVPRLGLGRAQAA